MAVSGKNSYVVGVRNGNWNEDMRGDALGKTLLTAHPKLETTEYRTQYFNRGNADTAGPAPRSLDSLDGHLVMAHGVNIVDRKPPPTHYLSFNQAAFSKIKEKEVLDGTVGVNVERTELMRKKAMLRSAGIDPWDPPAVTASVSKTIIPMTVTPNLKPVLEIAPKQSADNHYTSVTASTLSQAQSLRSTMNPRPEKDFSRDGVFTKTFKKGI